MECPNHARSTSRRGSNCRATELKTFTGFQAPVDGVAGASQTMDGSDLKVSDSSGSDRNPLRLPSERLLRRIETSGDLFAAAPEPVAEPAKRGLFALFGR